MKFRANTTIERKSWLRLIRTQRIGPITFWDLLRLYGSAEKAIENLPKIASKKAYTEISIPTIAAIDAEIKKTVQYDAKIILACDIEYPKLLLQIPDAPPVLTIKGQIPEMPMLAIVGSRNASTNGMHISNKLSKDLSEAGFCIVSGLAKGIDRIAHYASLANGTVAVIAGGIDHIYPTDNEQLYHDIIHNGAIISEMPFGALPLSRHFPQRNRIIAGLTKGVIVIEAAHKSGTLITANYALEYGREVFAVPGSPLDPRTEGTNNLIRNGAVLVRNAEDILEVIRSLRDDEYTSDFLASPPNYEEYDHNIVLDENILSRYREKLSYSLSYEPCSIAVLADSTAIPINILMYLIVEMELEGVIERDYLNRVYIMPTT